MLTTNPILKALMLLMLACLPGCVNQSAHRSWPKPVKASALSQFEGVYDNKGRDNKTGIRKGTSDGQGFYYFLTYGRDDDAEYDGARLDVRFSQDGRLMKLRLYNPQGKMIQSNNLQRGVHFDFTNGKIVRKSVSGAVRVFDAAIVGASYNHYELYTTNLGGILGHENSVGGMLVGFIVPVGGSENIWSYWPRLGDSKQ
jgi:hypothetical protein